MSQLAENLEKLETAIADACRRAGRRREDVELMAVSKTYPAEKGPRRAFVRQGR